MSAGEKCNFHDCYDSGELREYNKRTPGYSINSLYFLFRQFKRNIEVSIRKTIERR